jgi:cytochrome P450
MAKVEPLNIAHNKVVIAVLALTTHFVLHSSEWDHDLHIFLGLWSLAFGGLFTAEYLHQDHTKALAAAIQTTATIAAIYFGTLIASVLIYRGFFHRLRGIPGPFLARFTKFHSVFIGVLPDCQYWKYSGKLHEQYKTDVIRTGPREVLVFSADAIPLIHGANSRVGKGPWYSSATHVAGVSAHTARDKEEHKRRRKIWDHAFNAKSLREYEPRLNRHASALMAQLKKVAEQPSVRITDWVNYYSFDVMGDIGFNYNFGMVEKGEEAHVIKLLHESMAMFSIFSHLTWAMNLITRVPAGAKVLVDHIKWTQSVLLNRKKAEPEEKDIFSWLINSKEDTVSSEENGDARLLIVAGSDTTAATLGWASYELCANPKAQAKLRQLVDKIEPGKAHLEVDDVAKCDFLDGIINEVMRLHPAVPSGVQRETPAEGLTLPNGTYIPGNILMWQPIGNIHRDPRYFEKPLDFIPERWTEERPEAIIERRAFMPFGTGAYNCVGQKLAMMELRSVIANLVRSFEISFADGEDGSTILNKSQDCFTTNVAKLDVRLKSRRKDSVAA